MIVQIALSLLVFFIGITIDYKIRKLCALFSIEYYFLHFKEKEFTEDDAKKLDEYLSQLSPNFMKKARNQFRLITSFIILLQMISYIFIWLFL